LRGPVKMRILLIGSTGMLGSDCREVLNEDYEIIAPDKKELDIISWDRVIETLQAVSPDIVLNCAGFSDVDACETEPFTVRKVNVEGPRNLAQGSARFNCKLVHISTDYVFNGRKNLPQPYFEDDATDPLSAYGKSKTDSEVGVRENAPNYVIVRTGWLFGINGKNFIHSLLNNALNKKVKPLKVINDQFGSPTWTHRVALQIRELLKYDAKGTFHASSEGYCTWFDFAKIILKKLKLKVSLEPISLADYPQVAKRPVNCILENRLLKKQGLNLMQEWEQDVKTYLHQFGSELVKRAKAGSL
jgi:dTDP-4-dehydrorhamnose reductase